MARNPLAPGDDPYAPLPTNIPVPEPVGQYQVAPPGGWQKTYPSWRNPYNTWAEWQVPREESQRFAFEKNPQAAYQLYTRALGGSPGGDLERFMQSQFGKVWAEYLRKTTDLNQPVGKMFVDNLEGSTANQMRREWQGQNPYARGENFATMGPGRRVG
jgi:hypothetical protein